MIYIYKSCKDSCRACGKVCDASCQPCLKVLDRPLGWYVMFSATLNVLVLAFAALALTDPSVKECDSPVFMFVLLSALLAVCHIMFAFHAQSKLTEGMNDLDASQMSSREIMDRGWRIMVYDVGFCLYFFVFWFSLVWNIMGISWVGGCPDIDSPFANLCAVFEVLFSFLTLWLLFLYWFALQCDECCGGCGWGKKTPAQGSSHQGFIMRMLLGSPSRRQAPVRQPPQVQPQTVAGTVVQPQPMQYGQAAPQQQPQQQQPQQQQPQQQSMGAAVGGAALNALGGMLQGAGKKMQQGGKK